MKKIVLLLIVLFILPLNVYAENVFSSLPITLEDDKYYLDLNMAELDLESFDIDSLSMGDIEEQKAYYGLTKIFETFIEKNNLSETLGLPSSYNKETKEVKAGYCDGINECENKTFYLKTLKKDEKTKKELNKLRSKVKNSYSISGFDAINSSFYIGDIADASNLKNILGYQFKELKELIIEYEEAGYKIEMYFDRGGATEYYAERKVILIVYKDDVICDLIETSVEVKFILNVPTGTDSLTNRTINILKNHFAEEDVTLISDDEFSENIDNILEYENINTNANIINFKVNDKNFYVLVVEKDDNVDEYNVSAKNNQTGIEISSNSYKVPVDVRLFTDDIKNEIYIKQLGINDELNILKAFDINLQSMSLENYIKNIPTGVTVNIPITGYKENDIIDVYHVKENGTLGEKYEAKVIKINDVLYASFKTNHFSDYIITNENLQKNTTQVTSILENPQTGDDVIVSIILGILSVIGIASVIIYIKKRFN